jgi:hypothetical protein
MYKCNDEFFNIIDTPEKMYILGVFITDGCLGSQDNLLKFSMKDKDVLDIIKRCLKSDSPIKYRNNQREYYEFCLYNKNIYNSLLNLGFTPRKTNTVSIPDFLPEDLSSHLIRGLIDGDGCIYKGEKLITVSLVGTYNVISYFKKTIENIIDINFNPYQDTRSPNLYSYYISKKNVEPVLKWIYSDSENLRMERKYQKYLGLNS